MAENKKSFLLYTDQIGLFNQLPDELAGKLIKHIFAYVNDEQPETDDLLLTIAFEPIKTQLKRDLRKYEEYVEKQKVNGAKGGRPKKPTETQKTQPFFEKPKKPDNDNVNVNDNVNEIKYYRVIKHLKLSFDEFDNLLKDYTKEQIDNILDNIENYKKNTQYISLFLTAKSWLSKDYKKREETKPQTQSKLFKAE